MNLRKTFLILPNLFTLSSVFCGFFSITLSLGGGDATQLYQAALAICFGFFFDTFDGRVARLTKTQSQLGLQLDSLADVITFGVAPAALMYRWGLNKLGPLGLILCWMYVSAGALRLARFNVLTQADKKPGKFIIGLPIPAAAAVLVGLVVLNHVEPGVGYLAARQGLLGALVAFLSGLMISRVRFRSFKDFRLTRRSLVFVLLLVGAVISMAIERGTAFVFLLLITTYVALGVSEEVIFYRRRRAEAIAEKAAQPATAAREAAEDEEVLRELGAFDNEEGDATPAPRAPADAAVTDAGRSRG